MEDMKYLDCLIDIEEGFEALKAEYRHYSSGGGHEVKKINDGLDKIAKAIDIIYGEIDTFKDGKKKITK